MELKMNQYQLPEKISFNFDELKTELEAKTSVYSTMVYTDDQIQAAKKDRADLNKLKKALNDERIRREKEYLVPFNAFKSQVNEIITIIDKPIGVIDQRVKEYEEQQKQDKKDNIQNFWNSCEVPEGLTLEKVFDPKWLNASTSMKSITESIDASINKFKEEMQTLANLPEFGFEAQQVYISTLDINKAIAEGHRMAEVAKKKAEAEEARAEEEAKKNAFPEDAMNPPVAEVPAVELPKFNQSTWMEPERTWVRFQALMSTEDAAALKKFFDSRHIEFKPI